MSSTPEEKQKIEEVLKNISEKSEKQAITIGIIIIVIITIGVITLINGCFSLFEIPENSSLYTPTYTNSESTFLYSGKIYVITDDDIGVLKTKDVPTSMSGFTENLVTILNKGDEIEVDYVGILSTRVYVIKKSGGAVSWKGWIPTDLLMKSVREK
ncbi:hypothetical protein KAS42_05880 [bacterium]|nr:hypothetical protein [bacterium]